MPVSVRALIPPANPTETLLIHKCSDCSWVFVVDTSDADTEQEQEARVAHSFMRHKCDDYPKI